jgi:hypothetical protein
LQQTLPQLIDLFSNPQVTNSVDKIKKIRQNLQRENHCVIALGNANLKADHVMAEEICRVIGLNKSLIFSES